MESGMRAIRTNEEQENWGMTVVERVIYPIAVVATPGFLLVLMIYFVVRSFSHGPSSGVRSFAAVLLPLMIFTFLAKYRKEELHRAVRFSNGLVFGFTLLVGVAVMELLTLAPTGVPLTELVLSGSFSVLFFSFTAFPDDKDKAMFYYFGMILGFLGYVVILGFPKLPQ